MILRYGGSNFYGFKESFEIDLRLNKNCPEEISGGKDVTSVMCIKGANAAGKTNALKAISFICNFMANSFGTNPKDQIELETYFSNKHSTYLFCEFRIANKNYRYDLSIKEHEITEEKLTLISDPNNELFIRRRNQVVSTESEYSALLSIPQLRSNASLISIANQHEIKCVEDIHHFLASIVTNVDKSGYIEDLTDDRISLLYTLKPELLDFVIKQLQKFDTGIVDIKIDFYENFKGEKVFFPYFFFEVEGKAKKLRMNYQSTGTRRLYKLLGLIGLILNDTKDYTFCPALIIDELDLHLHSDIIPELINLFEEQQCVQLIFTCQNDHILDQMGKYRTTLINKEDNESYSYRLDELPSDLLRNNRPITPHYKKGSIGGVPNIGEDEVSNSGE